MSTMYSDSQIFLLFIMYSMFGWFCEVLYVGIFFEHKFVNRGFLHGPICPIYGFGGLIVMHGLRNWTGTWIQLFFATALLCSALEYVSSWLLETMFQTKWWDYSNKKFNLNGRICLLNSSLFGVMGVVFVHYIEPLILSLLNLLSPAATDWTARGILIVFTADLINTVRRLVNFSTTMVKLKEFREELESRFASELWFKKQNLREMLSSIKQQSEQNREQFNKTLLDKVESFQQHQKNAEGLLKRFPSMSSKNYAASLALIRTRLREGFEEKRAEYLNRKTGK